MATLNLGRLKPVFRGSWNNATAYNVDDIVVRNNQSYISIQAGTNQDPATATAYWTLMAAAGTDVGQTLSTQGDILYRDGSGLQRLAKGSSGQVLKQGTNHPEWGTDAGGAVLAVSHKSYGGTNSINTQNRTSDFTFTGASYEISQLTLSMTPSASTSKFLLQMNLQASHSDPHMGMGWITYQVAGGTEYAITSSGTRGITFRYDADSVT